VALKALLTEEEFGKIAEAVKGEYAKDAKGRFVLQVAPVDGWGLEDVGGLKASLAKERDGHGAVIKKLEAFGDLDPEKARGALKKIAEWGEDDPGERAKKLWGDKEKALLEKHAADLAARQKDADELRSQLENELVTSAALSALAKHKGATELLLPHVRSAVKIEKDHSGRLVPKVVNPDGSSRLSMRTGNTDPMTIEEYVETMKGNPSYALAFQGSGASGSGKGSPEVGGGSGKFRMTESQARDPAAFQRMHAEAAKSGQAVEIV